VGRGVGQSDDGAGGRSSTIKPVPCYYRPWAGRRGHCVSLGCLGGLSSPFPQPLENRYLRSTYVLYVCTARTNAPGYHTPTYDFPRPDLHAAATTKPFVSDSP
jgi:hypothetical protein